MMSMCYDRYDMKLSIACDHFLHFVSQEIKSSRATRRSASSLCLHGAHLGVKWDPNLDLISHHSISTTTQVKTSTVLIPLG